MMLVASMMDSQEKLIISQATGDARMKSKGESKLMIIFILNNFDNNNNNNKSLN
jgi:hypothetical protein